MKSFLALLASACLIGCAPAPKPVHRASTKHHSAKPDTSINAALKQNSEDIKAIQQRHDEIDSSHPSVISGNNTGTLVGIEWVDKYHRYEAKFGAIAEDKNIKREGDQYRIPSKVSHHFDDMIIKESSPQ
jgi:hypothetical protein